METLTIIIVVVFLFFPWFLRKTEKKVKIIKWLGPIVICYIIGMILGNISLNLDTQILQTTTEISVCLAIPLLLFSSNIKKWSKYAKSGLFSFLLGVCSVVISSVIAYFVFKDQIADPWKISGMMIGVYTGGTPNMSAIGIALDVEEEIFVLLNSADIVFSALYFVFLLTIAKKVFQFFLPKFKNTNHNQKEQQQININAKFQKSDRLSVLLSMVLAIIILGISVLISMLLVGRMSAQIIILSITTLGISASFFSRVQKLRYTYQSAEYLLMIFALSMGAMANFAELLAASSVVFYYCGLVVLISVVVHLFSAYLFRLDADTVIITSTAAIFGPAFIGPVANAIKNEKIIAFGIIMGLVGYAIGNYLGLAVAWFLK